VRDDSSRDGIGAVVDSFDALAANFERMIALYKADGADAEVIARLENARACASHGADVARQASHPPSQ